MQQHKTYSKRLKKWDNSHGHRFTHDLFKFPGKFHPPIVENILKQFRPKAVIDPMAGVGTVAVEAKTLGIPSLSIDVDPVCTFFTRVKTTPISEETLETAWKSLQPVLEEMRRSESQIKRFYFADITTSTMQKYLAKVNASNLAWLDYWFRKYVLVDFARIDHSILNGGLPHSSHKVRRFFTACLLSSVRRISNADPSPVSGVEITKQMRKKLIAGYEIDVVAEFERRVCTNIERMGNYVRYLRESGTLDTRVDVIQDDCFNIRTIKENFPYQANLILFSPPYCNAIEYWRRHRLEYFLGKFIAREHIGRHHRRFIGRSTVGRSTYGYPLRLGQNDCDELIRSLYKTGRDHKAMQLWHYFHDMKRRLEIFFSVLPPKGHAIIIVGDSRTSGNLIPTTRILTDLAVRSGFGLDAVVRYPIKNRTMQYPLKNGHSKIMEESILALRKSAG